MKLISYLLLPLFAIFLLILLDQKNYDINSKQKAIQEVTSKMKYSSISMTFKDQKMKEFVYVH